MGILDDIKNMKPVNDKVFTVSDLIKIFNKIPCSSKENETIKRYRNNPSNYLMSVDIGKGDDSTIIKCSNGVKITIDKNNINDFIITDDEVSEVVKILKKEMMLNNENDKSKEIGINEMD